MAMALALAMALAMAMAMALALAMALAMAMAMTLALYEENKTNHGRELIFPNHLYKQFQEQANKLLK